MSGLFDLAKEAEKLEVWLKGHPIPGRDRDLWCADDFGNFLRFDQYGDRSSDYGWEIDHIQPNALGGLNVLANKRPLHCRVNAGLGGLLGNALRSTTPR